MQTGLNAIPETKNRLLKGPLGAMEWNIGTLTGGSPIVGDLWVKMGYPC